MDLRRYAKVRDQEQLQFYTKRLLQQLPYFYALAIVLEPAYRLLPIFESYYPEEEWVRKLLVSIASFGAPPDDSVAEMALSQSFSEAGMGNYMKAIYDITQAMQDKHTLEARVGFMTSAVVNVVMTELVEAWYGDKPNLWHTVRVDPPTEESVDIAYEFWTSEQTAQLDTQNWLDLADTLESVLNRL